MVERRLAQGDLQAHVMSALWSLEQGTVEQVRAELPRPKAYTTVQTVLNRLVERGLVTREREGRSFVYRAALGEDAMASQALVRALAGASSATRATVFARALPRMATEELNRLLRLVDAELEARRPSRGTD